LGKVTAIAECGTGKTFISLGAMFVNSNGKPFTALVSVRVPDVVVEQGIQ
jgi:hypothetical protein